MTNKILTVTDIAARLDGVIDSSYKWPEIIKAWYLNFIVYACGSIDIDFFNPASEVFWSEKHCQPNAPTLSNGNPITSLELIKAGIPFIKTVGHKTKAA